MRFMVYGICALVLLGGGFSVTAHAAKKDVPMYCYKSGTGERIGGVYVDFYFGGPKQGKDPARKCNEKYAGDCGGQCWGCSVFLDLGTPADCYDQNGKCHGECGGMP